MKSCVSEWKELEFAKAAWKESGMSEMVWIIMQMQQNVTHIEEVMRVSKKLMTEKVPAQSRVSLKLICPSGEVRIQVIVELCQ